MATYHAFSVMAHKADFFRYCVLYAKGGVWLDIKTKLLVPLSDVFSRRHGVWYTSINALVGFNKVSLNQGLIASPPGNPVLKAAIDLLIATPPSALGGKDAGNEMCAPARGDAPASARATAECGALSLRTGACRYGLVCQQLYQVAAAAHGTAPRVGEVAPGPGSGGLALVLLDRYVTFDLSAPDPDFYGLRNAKGEPLRGMAPAFFINQSIYGADGKLVMLHREGTYPWRAGAPPARKPMSRAVRYRAKFFMKLSSLVLQLCKYFWEWSGGMRFWPLVVLDRGPKGAYRAWKLDALERA